MNKFLCLLTVTTMLVGCSSLLPGRVEFGQKKVKEVPAKSEVRGEKEKAAAQYVADKTKETLFAASSEGSSTNVVNPAGKAAKVADSLSHSLGKPLSPFPTNTSAEVVSKQLDKETAKDDRSLDKFRDKQQPLVGKEIEGTGFINVSYFTWVGIVLGVGFLVWTGLKIASAMNPAVSMGYNIARGAGKTILNRGWVEVLKGGENFKNTMKSLDGFSEEQKESILEIFRDEHMKAQSTEVQELIAKLTKK